MSRGNQKIIKEEVTFTKKRKPTLETFGYAAPIKNQLISESLIDDIQKKRATLFKEQHQVHVGTDKVIGLKTVSKDNEVISEDPELRAPLTLSESIGINSA